MFSLLLKDEMAVFIDSFASCVAVESCSMAVLQDLIICSLSFSIAKVCSLLCCSKRDTIECILS